MTPSDIQRALTDFYRIEIPHDVEDFLCDRALAERTTGQDPGPRGEVFLLAEGGNHEDTHIGLYLAPEALEQLAAGGDAWGDGRAHYASLATEGVSHFLYVLFRAEREETLSQLELELQAEVDKYAAATLLFSPEQMMRGFGVGLIRSREMRRRIFIEAKFLDAPESEAGVRYRTATRLAARYTRALEERFLRHGNLEGWRADLAAFYRMPFRRKLEAATSR
ncbi:MAG: hypothetical protein AAGF12_41630 [Myxococcota bacterium]